MMMRMMVSKRKNVVSTAHNYILIVTFLCLSIYCCVPCSAQQITLPNAVMKTGGTTTTIGGGNKRQQNDKRLRATYKQQQKKNYNPRPVVLVDSHNSGREIITYNEEEDNNRKYYSNKQTNDIFDTDTGRNVDNNNHDFYIR